MKHYLLLMYAPVFADKERHPTYDWENYFLRLSLSGHLEGGSAIGAGACFSKLTPDRSVTPHLKGFLRINAKDMDEAKTFLHGNPIYEAGGSVEIRELPSKG